MSYADDAVRSAINGKQVFCKFLSANDTGETGGHQSGIYISKPAVPIIFNKSGVRGLNMDRWAHIVWQDGYSTDTRFIYYGQGSRNEYRITNFGRGFPYLRPEYTGALFVLVQNDYDNYAGFVLNTEDDINYFLDSFALSPAETNRLIDRSPVDLEELEDIEMSWYADKLNNKFPTSKEMSSAARAIYDKIYKDKIDVINDPDKRLLDWTDIEYRLFRFIENDFNREKISAGFHNMDEFVSYANQVLNRRKSRAGKSLEHHLAAIFDCNNLPYTAQAISEQNKHPDFLFPSKEKYHNPDWPVDKLIMLAAKTTCKDRWRQILNEADRLKTRTKFLCTLQQGISSAQMDEMNAEKVILVVPRTYIPTYPSDRQDRIWTLARFIRYVRETLS